MTLLTAVRFTTPVTLVTTAETAILTTTAPPANAHQIAQFSPARVAVKGYVNITTGGGNTSLTVRIRAGSGIAGTIIGANTITWGANSNDSIPFAEIDISNFITNGYVYTLTVQQTAATGNGTVNDGYIEVDPLIFSV